MAKTKKAPRKPRAKRPKQQKLFGDDRKEIIPEIDQTADAYYDAVRDRIPYTKVEAEAKVNLINAMIFGKKKRYETADGKIVDLTDNFNVRVKEAKEAAEEAAELNRDGQ